MSASPQGSHQGAREVLRRVLLLVVLIAAGVGLCYQRVDLVRVERADLGRTFAAERHAVPPAVHVARQLVRARRPSHPEAFDKLLERVAERPVLRRGDDPLLVPARDGYAQSGIVVTSGAHLALLELTWNDRDSPAPWQLRRPLIPYGIGSLVLAALIYLLLRWRKGEDVIACAEPWAAVAFDLSAAVFAFGAGAIVISAIVDGELAICLLAAPAFLGAVFLFACGLDSSVRRWRLVGSGISYSTSGGEQHFAFGDLAGYQAGRLEQSKAILLLYLVLGLLTVVSMFVGLRRLVRPPPQLRLLTRDGRRIVSSMQSRRGLAALVQVLEQHGIRELTG